MIIRSVDPGDLRAQGLSDGDIREVRAFAAFLRLSGPADGREREMPTPFYDYALGGPTPPEALVDEVLSQPLPPPTAP